MTITFECTACGTDFDLEIPRLVERPSALKCPACGAHPHPSRAHALASAIEDLVAAMANVRKRVRFELTLETDELPPPYGTAGDAEDDTGLDLDDASPPDEDSPRPKRRGRGAAPEKKVPLSTPIAPPKATTTVFDDDDLEDLDDGESELDDEEDEDDDLEDDDADDDAGEEDEDEDEEADDADEAPAKDADDEDEEEEDEDDDEEDEDDEAPAPPPRRRR